MKRRERMTDERHRVSRVIDSRARLALFLAGESSTGDGSSLVERNEGLG